MKNHLAASVRQNDRFIEPRGYLFMCTYLDTLHK